MKPTLSPEDEEIIELLKSLGTLRAEYPAELLAARRAAFIAKIEQHRANGASKTEYLSQERMVELLEHLGTLKAEYPAELLSARRAAFTARIEKYRANGASKAKDLSQERMIELLEGLKPVAAEYPAELLAARREAFIAQIRQHNETEVPAESPFQAQLIELLGNLKSASAEYPTELLAARRAAFVGQIRQHNSVSLPEAVLPSQNGKISKLFERLKAIEIEYPLKLWSSRRSDYVSQIRESKISVLDAVRSIFHSMFKRADKPVMAPAMGLRRLSMILATLLVAAFMGSLAYGNRPPITQMFATSSQGQVFQPSPVAAATGTNEVAKVICKPGYLPPLCLAKEFDKSRDLTFSGNGSARPAVAKDTIPGYSRIHKPAYVNDGLYGSGASWISNSAYSWIKIDLGEPRTINTITFGRDRLGNFNDGDPGQFIIAVALSDNVYADGNSSNDDKEYTPVYNSDEMGFDGIVTGAETIEAKFEPVNARYIKITFENARTAVDEIEVFMIQTPEYASHMTQRPRDTVVASTFTPVPTKTLIPSRTPLIPTNTLFPTYTSTPRPTLTFTPRPTDTAVPTDTPEPPTGTPEPPTDTPEPPTDTPHPPTDTPEPPSDTPEPPTPQPPTPEPPSDTPPPPPVNTPEAPTATADREIVFTETPAAPVGP